MTEDRDARPTALIWLRRDLRLVDNPALSRALERGMRPLLVYIDDAAGSGHWQEGAASRAWLRRSLAALDSDARALGGQLVLRRGDSLENLLDIVDAVDAAAVFWNRRYEPAHRQSDARVKQALRDRGLEREVAALLVAVLGELSRGPLLAVLDTLILERERAERERPRLLWTGPEPSTSTALDTRVELLELLRTAQSSVLCRSPRASPTPSCSSRSTRRCACARSRRR